jgi:hypothetical protein
MVDLVSVGSLSVANHGMKPLVRGIQLRLELGRIASVKPLLDLRVFGHDLVSMLADIASRGLNLVSREAEPDAISSGRQPS